MNSRINKVLAILLVLVVYVGLAYVTGEKDPNYQIRPTTWAGQPAYGQYHRNDWYTFYAWTPDGPGQEIASFPWGEAIHLR